MYSIVLMMAMTSAPETADFHGRALHYFNSCHGCCGGHSWHNGSCGGCWSSCHGCGGSGFAYSSYACSGCAGNVTSYHSCHGYTPNYYQPFSCFGYGIYGGTSYSWPIPYEGGGPGTYGYATPYSPNAMPRIEEKKEVEPKKADSKQGGQTMIYPTTPNKAQVVVRLPADAKLYANDTLTNLSSAERSFSTPSLEKGQDYQYSMKVEYTRDGKTVSDSQIVKVRAGEVSVVEFVDKSTAISTIKFVAPEGAKLFVENKLLGTSGSFKTPELTKGAEYAYSVRAELNRDGKTEASTQRVVFKAGEAVTVDFMDLGTIRTASK